ncbi:MAG: GNAT family acetyltransferase [Limisphaerales bacterium]
MSQDCEITQFHRPDHHDQVVQLWKDVFGYESMRNDPPLAIAKKEKMADGLFWVAVAGEKVVGSVMAGYDGHRGWIYSMAVDHSQRRSGVGEKLITHAENALRDRGCMKVNLQVMPGNDGAVSFYESCGYEFEERISMGKEFPENISYEEPVSDDEFIKQFEDRTLPFQKWTHRAHVKVAYLYLRDHPFDDALHKIRKNIKTYNAANNVPEEQFSGYNETTTHTFLRLVQATINAYEGIFPSDNADAFCDTHLQLRTTHLMRLFFTPEQRQHPDAKEQFVEPDLCQLP